MDRGSLLRLNCLVVNVWMRYRPTCSGTSRLIVNDELYTQPMDLFLTVEREAEAWPRTHHLLAGQGSMSANEYSYSGSRGYQQISFLKTIFHSCPSRGLRSVVDVQVEQLRVRPSK